MNDALILVDEDDRELGRAGKEECHDGEGILHRAFSVFLFDEEGRLLLQRRAPGKRLWPGYWSNSCCSHPRAGEETKAAARRRIVEELGLEKPIPLEWLFRFVYRAHFGEIGSEYELCHVFFGRVLDEQPVVDPLEIDALRTVTRADLEEELLHTPDRFSPWFRLEWARICRDHRHSLEQFTVSVV